MLRIAVLVVFAIIAVAVTAFNYFHSRQKRYLQKPPTLPVNEKKVFDDGHIIPLAEFDFRAVKPRPYRPFLTKLHVVMGIKKTTRSEWLQMDRGYLHRLEERRDTLLREAPTAIGTGDIVNPAIRELYKDVMVDYLPYRFPTMFAHRGGQLYNKVTGLSYALDYKTMDPAALLRNLSENVEEDFYIMCPDEEDAIRLQGYIACFPGGFLSPAKTGMSMMEIHGPVPGYDVKIGKNADNYLRRLQPGQFIERFNWSLQTDGVDLFRLDGNNYYPEPVEGSDTSVPAQIVSLDQTYLRVERQTLLRLAESRAVIFTVRSYMTSLADIKAEGNGVALAEAIESMPEALGLYKMRPFWEKDVLPYLRA